VTLMLNRQMIVVIVLFIVCSGVSALAQYRGAFSVRYPQFYVGGGYVYSMYSAKTVNGISADTYFPDRNHNLNAHGGVKFNKSFALEAGVTKSNEATKKVTYLGQSNTFSDSFFKYYLDAIGFYPLSSRIEVLGTGGVGMTAIDVTRKLPNGGKLKSSENNFTFRAGGGVQYNITRNFNARGILRYENQGSKELFGSSWNIDTGVNYAF
jgi:opacity protein-like surface antigen